MKLAILGASGKTGLLVLEQALAAGHVVTVLVRDPAKLKAQSDRLQVVQGDACDPARVEEIVAGAAAVLNLIGHTSGSPTDVQTVAAQNILAAMRQCCVKRLVTLTGAGIPDPKDQPKPVDRLFGLMLKWLSPEVIADGLRHIELIRASRVEWVIVRVPRLVDGPRTGRCRVGFVGPESGIQVSRADAADFMLRQAGDSAWVRQAPVISS